MPVDFKSTSCEHDIQSLVRSAPRCSFPVFCNVYDASHVHVISITELQARASGIFICVKLCVRFAIGVIDFYFQVGLQTPSSAASGISLAGSGTPVSRHIISNAANPDSQVHEPVAPVTTNTRSSGVAKTMPRIGSPSVATARRYLGYKKAAQLLPDSPVMDKRGSPSSKLPTTSMRQILANGASPIAKQQGTPRSIWKDSYKRDKWQWRPLAKTAGLLLGIAAIVMLRTKETPKMEPQKANADKKVPQSTGRLKSQRDKLVIIPFI